jgi:hypothetical protein
MNTPHLLSGGDMKKRVPFLRRNTLGSCENKIIIYFFISSFPGLHIQDQGYGPYALISFRQMVYS